MTDPVLEMNSAPAQEEMAEALIVTDAPEVARTATTDLDAPAATTGSDAPKPAKPKVKKKSPKRFIKWGILALVLLLVGFGLYKLMAPAEDETTVVTDTVTYGSITSMVEGYGQTKAKNSETITLTTSGTVVDVFVTEGQTVTAGTPLFSIDSTAAKAAVEKARKDAEGYQKELDTYYKDIAGLNLTAPFAGKLLETKEFEVGATIAKDAPVAKLVEDGRLRLEQYYSYAYSGQIKEGQSATISVPALMSTLPGKVESVHMVERVSAEGSKMFKVVFVLKNPDTLTADMVASAVLEVDGETVYPYESGKLEYYRTSELKTSVGGTVQWVSLMDYQSVTAGQSLMRIDGADSESKIFTLEQNLENAQEELAKAEKNLANCNAVAPIDGTVIGLMLTLGQEIAANTAVISIADTTSIRVDATVDERNISFVKAGMTVELDQWGTPFVGIVDTVSLSSKVENGVASYPMVITVDNPDGSVQTGSGVNYKLAASQNDNCLLLPIQSVKNVQLDEQGTSGYVVFVQANKRPENAIDLPVPPEDVPEGYYAVPVEIGISDNYNVEIKSGVEDGTVVFTTVQRQNSWGY